MKMPYGKFKDCEIEDLPSGYLRWIAENWTEDTPKNERICTVADLEYQEREKTGTHFEDDSLLLKAEGRLKCPHCGKEI